jgi:hypothetical protein
MTWTYAGRTGVDSGSILITDPCYVVRNPGEQHYTPFESYDQLLGAVEATFEPSHVPAVQLTNQFGADIGVYLTRFGGDGVFPVYVQRDSRGQIVAAQIRFDGQQP